MLKEGITPTPSAVENSAALMAWRNSTDSAVKFGEFLQVARTVIVGFRRKSQTLELKCLLTKPDWLQKPAKKF
jgi:hypothetical protein